ncbi:MAG TPA: hypothetical protein VKG65_04255 [Terriglobales bacterium]|nr:hypothetical protein [Terriglobales bacterium]
MRGIRTLKTVSDNLSSIELPSLRRPSVKPDEPKTEELIRWGICMFVYSLIAHMQKILAGLVALAEVENVAATAPLCRHVFEWTALSCYLTRRLTDLFTKHDWDEAWALLTKAALGSDWAGKYGSKYSGDPPVKLPVEIPGPVRVGRAVEEYEKYQTENSMEPEAKDSYSLLCDFAHPNAACLLRYQAPEENGTVIRFVDPDQDTQQETFLPFVNCCLIDLLFFIDELLKLANESTVRPKVKLVLDELAAAARQAAARRQAAASSTFNGIIKAG